MDREGSPGPLDWAVATRPMPGETVSGDHSVVVPQGDRVLMAVIDGLGHGPEAAAPARMAAETIHDNPGEPLDALVTLCHHELEGTRGAAMTISSVDLVASTLTWLGVGNVEAYIVRNDGVRTSIVEAALLAGGVVGFRLPQLRSQTVSLRPGDVLLMATDGVGHPLPERIHVGKPANVSAGIILETCARQSDDALVLVARYQSRQA